MESQTESQKSQAKTKKMIVIDPEKWKLIVDFISGLQIPIQQSANGYNVVMTINSAKEVDAEVKETKK